MDRKQFNRVVSAALVLRAVCKETNVPCTDLHTLIGDAFANLSNDSLPKVSQPPKKVYLDHSFTGLELPNQNDMDLLRDDKKIDAVKAYKFRTGYSLMESKKVIEAYGDHLRITHCTLNFYYEIK
jgi:hypothetical protein